VGQRKFPWGKAVMASFVLSVLIACGFAVEVAYKTSWTSTGAVETWSQRDELNWVAGKVLAKTGSANYTWNGGPILLRMPTDKGSSANCTFWPVAAFAQNARRDPSTSQDVQLALPYGASKTFEWQGTPHVQAPAKIICTRTDKSPTGNIRIYTGNNIALVNSVSGRGTWWIRGSISAVPFVLTVVAMWIFGRNSEDDAPPPPPPEHAPAGPPPPPPPPSPGPPPPGD
jgi:hypothetical protein